MTDLPVSILLETLSISIKARIRRTAACQLTNNITHMNAYNTLTTN